MGGGRAAPMSSQQRLLLLPLLLPLLSSLHPPLPQLLRNLELRMLELPLSVQSTSFCFSVADTGFFLSGAGCGAGDDEQE